MLGGWQFVSLQRRDWLLGRVTRARFTRLNNRYRRRQLIDFVVKIRDLNRSSDIFQTIEPWLPI
jgi:2-oxo-4-hydroxy-4-carboxy--5-ureidoimidazoline (OHCU) decarboxylase